MIWPLVRDFRCPFAWNDITEIVSKYERWTKLNEWGPEFEEGYILRHRSFGLLFCRILCDLPTVGYGHGDWTVFYDRVSEQPDGFDWRHIGISR